MVDRKVIRVMVTYKAVTDSVQLSFMDWLARTGMGMQPVTAFSWETLKLVFWMLAGAVLCN